MTEAVPVVLRPAEPADLPALLEMIRELATFEALGDTVHVSSETLEAGLFGTRKIASALVAHVHSRPAGYAVFYPTFSTFLGRTGLFLEDLYVRAEFRRMGIGRALFEKVAAAAAELGGRLEWTALGWNDHALRLYREWGAHILSDWVLLRISPPHPQLTEPPR